MSSSDLNDPPTAVGGIEPALGGEVCRKDLKDPPTSVGGIEPRCVQDFIERT